jgi:hypothetical protein
MQIKKKIKKRHRLLRRFIFRLTFPIALSIYLWLYNPLLDLGRFFSFLILYTVGRTPWAGD